MRPARQVAVASRAPRLHLLRPVPTSPIPTGDRDPVAMMVSATVSCFPVMQEAQYSRGVQWVISVAPFALAYFRSQPLATGDFDTYCDVDRLGWGWVSTLCGTLNDDALRCTEECPELNPSFVYAPYEATAGGRSVNTTTGSSEVISLGQHHRWKTIFTPWFGASSNF